MMKRFRDYFFTGLLTTLPVFLVLYLASWLLGLLGKFGYLIPAFLLDELLAAGLPYWMINALVALLHLIVIVVVGAVSGKYVGAKVLEKISLWMESLPVVGGIYKASRSLLNTVFQGRNESFRGVCLVEYPRLGMWSMAFITGDAPKIFQEKLPEDRMINIFIPTTPNPTSGFYMVVSSGQIKPLNISVQEAFSILLSAGAVQTTSTERHGTRS